MMNEQLKTVHATWEDDLAWYVESFGLRRVVHELARYCHSRAESLRAFSRKHKDLSARVEAGLRGTAGGALNVAANKCRNLAAVDKEDANTSTEA